MSATADGPDPDHAYFQAVEEIFVELRGSPLLLSPADWQVARRWHQEGVPLDLVRQTLEEVFAKRRERGAKGKISSLRYCAPAVEAAWSDFKELIAPGHRAAAPVFEVGPRLAALAAALPSGLSGLAARVAALAGDPQQVEDRLAALDREMLDAAAAGLTGEDRAEIGAAVEKTLTLLGGRLPADELATSRARLFRQALRRRLGLPVLSLFSPEAEPREAPPMI
ncbi:MAG TPA: hypothetical protein VIA62_09095 [Thermoanaerobaculia bacterium]|jgi:hypothetical protein|nr:hypothetical protein [Thermoanaerobaculia bacterium]